MQQPFTRLQSARIDASGAGLGLAIVARVAPEVAVPLPQVWDGPMETADTSAYNAHNLAAYSDVPVPQPGE